VAAIGCVPNRADWGRFAYTHLEIASYSELENLELGDDESQILLE
jgi:hypothetical protein